MSVPANIGSLRWAKQSAQGTAVVNTNSVFGSRPAGSGVQLGPVRVDAPFLEMTGGRMRSDRFASSIMVGGDCELYAMPSSLGSLLYAVCGAVSTTGGTDPYTHTIKPTTSRPWWTFWRMLGGLIWEKYVDVKVDKLVIKGTSGQPLLVTASMQGIKPLAQTAEETGATLEVTNRSLYYDGLGALKFEGSAVATIEDFELTIANNGQAIMGDAFWPVDVSEGELDVTMKITRVLLASSLRERLYFGSASPSSGDPPITDILELVGSPAGIDFKFVRVASTRTLELKLPRVALEPYDNQGSTNPTDYLKDSLSLVALAPADGSDPFQAIVQNSRATPY